MKVAISTDHGAVSAHFGRCPSFTLVEIQDGRVMHKEEIQNPGHQPGFLPEFLSERGVTCIVAGGMGRRALQFFEGAGIRPILGVQGSVDEVADKLAQGLLEPGESLCTPGSGKGYGMEKSACDHEGHGHDDCERREE
jgi:predicted Fe-Mo cluster-binding NifX family protein